MGETDECHLPSLSNLSKSSHIRMPPPLESLPWLEYPEQQDITKQKINTSAYSE